MGREGRERKEDKVRGGEGRGGEGALVRSCSTPCDSESLCLHQYYHTSPTDLSQS